MKKRMLAVTLAALGLSACGGSGDDNTDEQSNVLTGVFIDSAVSGVNYSTDSQSGVTTEAGEFTFLSGETLTLAIGGSQLPQVLAMESISPLDLFETTDVYDTSVVNLSRLLQSLDVDGDPVNGIEISAQASTSAPTNSLDFAQGVDEFANDTDVVNLLANSGSTNNELISADDAIQHLQETLVASGDIESTDKLAFSRLISGNTFVFGSGSSIYYREDGTKFSRRQNGNEFVGTWTLDANGLVCEDLRGGESTFCIAESENFLVTKHPDSDSYYYSETGFSSVLVISAGDILNLSGVASVVGTWDVVYENNCIEKFTFNTDGTIDSIDFEEIQTGTYNLGGAPVANNRYAIDFIIETDNQLPGCDGETESSAGRQLSFFAEIESNVIRYYASTESADIVFQMTRP